MSIHLLTADAPVGAEAWFQIPDAPLALWVEGNVDLLAHLPARGLGIVGTRQPQARACSEVRRVLADLCQSSPVSPAPWIIVSGLARGIDGEAHRAALALGLPTVAVLGCGIESTYPPEHASLREQIVAAGGAVVSEFLPASPPRKAHFVQRNRLIVAGSEAVWVVEAPVRSGALSSAAWAGRLGRALFATPAFPGDPAFAGNARLLRTDRARALYGATDLSDAWPELARRESRAASPERARQRLPETPARAQAQELVAEVHRLTLTQGGATADQLLETSLAKGLSSAEHFRLIAQAEADGWVRNSLGVWTSGSIDAGRLPPT